MHSLAPPLHGGSLASSALPNPTNVSLDGLVRRYGCFQACAEYLIEHGAELAAELALANAVDASDVDVDASLNVSLE